MTSVCMTVATNRDVSKDNDTAKQIASKVEFLRNLAKQMEDAMSVIASCPADSHIRVKGNKTISELSSDLTKSDIQEIEFLGIANIFELEIFKPEVRYSPFMEIFIGACAILQMAAGLMITVGSVGAGSSFGASIFAEGIMDAYRLARGEGGVDLAEYFTQKGISYACMGVQAGIGKLASSASAKAAAGKLMEESAKQGISLTTEQAKALVATHALEVSAIAAANQTKGALIEQAIKVAGTQVAMAIGTQILAEKVSGFVRKSAFEGLEERISSRIENASYDELGRHMSLTDAKAQIEQDQLLRAEGRIAAKLLHEPRNMRIVKELSRAVLSTVTSHALSGSSRLAALATNFAISGMQSAASSTDIMPLADELADEVRVEIATKDTAAKTRLAREKQAGNKDAVAKAEGDEGNRRNLSHRLGEIGASYIMSAVEGRVIAPIVSVAAGKVIDMAVGTYMRAQEELLREYHSQYHAAKATAATGVAAGDSGEGAANGQAEEEIDGLPWLDQDGDDSNRTGVTRKGGSNGKSVVFSEEEIVVSKPHVQKAKTALKLTSKTPSAVQRAQEEAASQRVIAAIKLKEQMLGMPVTDEELSALALTSERPIYITEDGKFHTAFGTSLKAKPVVVERETSFSEAIRTNETFERIFPDIHRDFFNPATANPKYFGNTAAASVAIVGEFMQFTAANVGNVIKELPGGGYILSAVGSGFELISECVVGSGKFILPKTTVSYLQNEYYQLPEGLKIVVDAITDGSILMGGLKVGAMASKLGVVATKSITMLPIITAAETFTLPSEFFIHLPKTSIFTSVESLDILKPLHSKGAIYFDSGLSVIEEAMHSGIKLSELPAVIQKDFAALVKTDANGVINGFHHMENHHVLPKATPEFKAIFEKAEISIDDPINRMLLPDSAGKNLYPTEKTMHSGKHSKDSYAHTLKEVKDVIELGEKKSWTAIDYKKEIIRIISEEKPFLKDGTRKLNEAQTLLEKVKDASSK